LRHRVLALLLAIAVTQTAYSQQPSTFSATLSPNPLTLRAGGPSQTLTVSTQADGFVGSTITYSISGLPAGIQNDGPKTTTFSQVDPVPYAPVTFNLTAAPGVPGGTYSGTLTGSASNGVTRTFPFTVVVQQPSIAISIEQPLMNLCAGGAPQSNAVRLDPVDGYQGSPVVEFLNVPAGVTISPNPLPPASLPPGRTLPFTVSASQPGSYSITARVVDGAAGVSRTATLTLQVTAPSFTTTLSATQLELTPGGNSSQVNASVVPGTCLTQDVTVTVAAPPGITVTPQTRTISAPSYPGASFSVGATATAAPGAYLVTFTFTSPGAQTRTETLTVTVRDARDFALRATPSTVTVAAGSAADLNVSVEALNGFQGSVAVTSSAPAGITLTPSTFSLTPGATQRVIVSPSQSVAPGQYSISFTGTAAGVAQPRSVTVTINVLPAPTFSLELVPPAVQVNQGSNTASTLHVRGANAFVDSVSVNVQAPQFLTIAPAQFTIQNNGSQALTITAAADAPVGTHSVIFTGISPSGLVRTVPLRVDVVPVAPVITLLDPPAVSTGVRSQVVRVIGTNFRPGAIVMSRTSGVVVERVDVVSSTLAIVTLSVREDATVGPYTLDLRNPLGGSTAQGAVLLVFPRESLAAPLGVTAAAIVFPRSGTIVASDEAVYPRGVLATSGSGTIVGEWRLDGAAFDLFTAVVSGGMPTEVRSHVAIPPRVAGTSRLELVVTSPQLAVSPEVTIVHAIDTASRFQIYEPRHGTVIGRVLAPPLFRWSLAPGVTGYEVEVVDPRTDTAVRFRTERSEWQPTARDLASLGTGIRVWRARPVFPGEVRGEPTQWSRIVLLPEEVTLTLESVALDPRTGDLTVRWAGGGPGLVYRVEFFDAVTGNVVLQSLALGDDYRLPRAIASTVRGRSVRVVALTPEGHVVSTTSARVVARGHDRTSEIFLAQAPSSVRLVAAQPQQGTSVTTDRPRISAQWSGAVPADQVALVLDSTDVTAVATVTPTSITYDALIPLVAGTHTVRLAAGDLSTSWTFTVARPSEDAPSAAAEPVPQQAGDPSAQTTTVPPVRRDWALTPVASISARSGDEQDSAALQLSTQADLGTPALSSKLAGDLSFRHPLEGSGSTRQESQNWLFNLGGSQGAFSEQLSVGYVVPEFLDQTQFLTFGAARGGATGKVATPIGSFSMFQSFESTLTGVVAGSFTPVQKVRAYAYEAPTRNQRFTLRAIALDVDEEPGVYNAGGEGDTVGLFARYAFSSAINLIAEAARGSFESRSLTEGEREGDAIRLGLNGTRGRMSYQVNLRRTDANYVNPANRGFTAGSVSDRQGGDVSVSAMLGRAAISVTARHLESGGSDSRSPEAEEDGVTATVSSMLGRILNVSASVNFTADESEADLARALPAVERSVAGGQLTFGQLIGRLSLGQTLQYNRTNSRVGPYGDAVVRGATFTGAGPISSFANLSAFVSMIRSETTPEAGVNDQLIVTLQPSIALGRYAFSLQPVFSYSKMKNDRLGLDTESQSFTPMVTWTPPWLQQALALQLSGGWRRTESIGQPASEPDPTYAASLSFRWPLRRGALRTDGTVLPGATPIAAPELGSSDPVNSADTAPANQ
jgi:hypothetical protein